MQLHKIKKICSNSQKIIFVPCQTGIFIPSMLILLIVTTFLLLLYAGLMGRLQKAWESIPGWKPVPEGSYRPRIAVIIPARNEDANIAACLESLLAQDYPAGSREFIVVDDHSEDGTAGIAAEYDAKYTDIRLLKLADHLHGQEAGTAFKKKAIDLAIQQSNADIIVTTDADCLFPRGWLLNISSTYQDPDVICLVMPVAYRMDAVYPSFGRKFLHLFQSLDFMTLQGITGAWMQQKAPALCNGANFSYRKHAFLSVGGFSGVEQRASGDDVFLLQKIHRAFPGQCRYLKSREVLVETRPVDRLPDFFRQRIRWAGKSGQIMGGQLLPAMLLVYFVNLSLLLSWIWTLVDTKAIIGLHPALWCLLLTSLKCLLEWPFMQSLAEFFHKKPLMRWFPLMQPFHILYTVLIGVLGATGRTEWKGRRVR